MMENLVWTEKYRPKTLDEVIMDESEKVKIRAFIEKPSEMPNLLLVTKSPGTGKTTLCRVIGRELKVSSRDFRFMNSSDERKIEHIRELKDFCLSRSMAGNIKLVQMDEFDGMRGESQDILRPIMERYHQTCKFLLTANDITKIDAAIQSRCTTIMLREPPKDQIFGRLRDICTKEQVQYTDEGINKLIDMFYPDIRSMINKLQQLSKVGVFIQNIRNDTQIEDEFYKLLWKRNFYDIRKYSIDNNLNPHATFLRVLQNLQTDKTAEEKYGKANFEQMQRDFSWTAAECSRGIAYGSDKEIELTAFVDKFLNTFR